MASSDADRMITLLAKMGIDARPSDRSVQIDRFQQWCDDDTLLTAGTCTICMTSVSPVPALV